MTPRRLVLLATIAAAGCASTRYPHLLDAAGCAIERLAVEPGRAQFQFNGLSPDGKQLAIGWEAATARGAYLLDLRTGARVLAPAPGQDGYPAWSPDGRQLVFSSDRASTPGRLDLHVMQADGSSVRRLTSGGHDSYAAWHRSTIYFVSQREGHGVYRLTLDGRGRCASPG